MSLPTWTQEAVGNGHDLSVCLELWKLASAIEREEHNEPFLEFYTRALRRPELVAV